MSARPDNNLEIKIKQKVKRLLTRIKYKNKAFDKSLIKVLKDDIEAFLNEINTLNINGFTAPIILKHLDTYAELIYMYLADRRPFSVAYSGGKDSTVTMDVVLKSLLLIKYMYGEDELHKTTYVLFSDTLLEMDPVIEGILNSIKAIKDFNNKFNLNIEVKRVTPPTKSTYFSLLIGKGYMMPSRTAKRWCTDRLKIQPQKKMILNILNNNKDGFIAITGQRQQESLERKNRMQKQTIDGSFKKHEFKNCNLYAPIEHWNVNDVWNHIYNHKLDWIDSLTLGRVYAEAANDGDECRSLLEGFDSGKSPGCGKSARYGCWCCQIFEEDKTLGALTKHYPYMKHMEELRNWFSLYRDGSWDDNRDVFIHGKHKMKTYDFDNHRKGMKIPGGYNLYFRKRMLSELLKTERKVIKERGIPLISDEELAYIQECWIEDGDLSMSVNEIAYDRNYEHLINPLYSKVLSSVKLMFKESKYSSHHHSNINWISIYDGLGRFAFDESKFCERYFCQMAIQLEKKEYNSKIYMSALTKRHCKTGFKDVAIHTIKQLPLETRMDFVDTAKEKYIRNEWKNDSIGFWTFMERKVNGEINEPELNLFGYDGDYASHFEALDEYREKGDIIHCEKISLEDKMRFFDNW